ncbi:PAS domain-containing protein [Methanobacterium oryzae]|uniref:PAS domain-containing protein n=1 Tax=Methanobacterium oryzae TaxID=69540 RepID=UPI003D1B1767
MMTKDAKSMYLPANIDFRIFDNFQEEVVIYEIINDILDKVGDLRVKYVNDASLNSEMFISKEIIGKTVTELFDKNMSSIHIKMANEALQFNVGKKYKVYFKELGKYYSVSAYLPDENIYITINNDITELKKEEKKTERAVENIALAYFELDNDWRFIDANAKIEHIMKRERDDLIDNIIWEEFPYLVDTEYYIQYNKAKRENKDVHFEIKSKHTGEWYEVHAHPHSQGLTVCFHNINKRKKAEKELIEQVEKLKDELKVSNLELETATNELNSVKEELNLQRDNLVNLNKKLRKNEEKYKYLAEKQNQVLLDEIEEITADLENSNKDLQIIKEELQSSKEELNLSNKELSAKTNDLQAANEELLLYGEKLKNLNQKLLEKKSQYKALAENLPAVIMRYDQNLKVVYLSPNSMQTTDISTEQFIGKNCRELGIPEKICDKWEIAIKKVFQTGETQEIEFEFPATNGKHPKIFKINFIPESDVQTIKHVLGISTDITELKNTERKLKEV